jgi:hypothetical protein
MWSGSVISYFLFYYFNSGFYFIFLNILIGDKNENVVDNRRFTLSDLESFEAGSKPFF